jgi:hypothetical protein
MVSGRNGIARAFATGATIIALRGVSSLTLQNGIQPSTAMVVDGVAVARQA